MGIRRFIVLPSVAGIGQVSSASLEVPVGGVIYHNLSLALTNIDLDEILNIELRLNGKPVMRWKDGSELDALNQFHGRGASANGILTIHFNRPELKVPSERDLTSISTGDVSTMSLHFDLNTASASPAVKAYATQEIDPKNQPLGIIQKIKRFPYNSAVSGQVEIANIPRSGARIAAIHFVKSDVSAVEIDVNSVRVFEGSKTLLLEVQKQAGKTQQAALMTSADFCLSGRLGDALATAGVADLRCRPTLTTSGVVDLVVEYLDGLPGL